MGGGGMMSEAGFTPAAIYEYLVKARAKLLDWVRPLTMEQYTKEFPFGKKTIRDTIVEIPHAEWLYGMRLAGESVPARDEQPFVKYYQTDFTPLESAWRELADRTGRLLREERDWARPVEYIIRPLNRPAVQIRATAGGIAAQMICHEVHHRAQVMAMLRQFGVAAENLDYTAFMVTRTELPA
jgi:uncharacterized damage-inducible protein DinB